MMLTEKRKMEDAQRDWAKSMAGHPVGFAFNMMTAMRDFHNGDYMEAAQRMVPDLLKRPMTAYKMSQYGYVDKSGQQLPITATATDIMMTAMGLDPAKEAEYREVSGVAGGLNARRQERSANISRHLLLAQSRGDAQMFQDWEQEAAQFQVDHPGKGGPLQHYGRSLAQHLRASATARGLNAPLGVRPTDNTGVNMTTFGNLRNE
jgi:hypothetical protein